MVFGWIAKLLSALFGKKKEGEKGKKPIHEKIHEGFYKRIYSNLLGLRNKIKSVRSEEGVKEAKKELERIRLEFRHLNQQQRKNLAGIFGECEYKINNLKWKFKKKAA